jgi:glycosyl-4,4'-diaponeurosporenoate acyltransferase
MPPLELPTPWVVILNILGWPVIQMGLAWIFIQLPARLFDSNYILPVYEVEHSIYEKVFAIRRWKDILPDGATWFRGGFSKRHLHRRDSGYFNRFLQESRRGEAAHWAMLLAAPIFALWNPPWAIAVMVIYALLANLPCIFAQRYNRLRLLTVQRNLSRRPPTNTMAAKEQPSEALPMRWSQK